VHSFLPSFWAPFAFSLVHFKHDTRYNRVMKKPDKVHEKKETPLWHVQDLIHGQIYKLS